LRLSASKDDLGIGLTIALLALATLTGGASLPDALGQSVVRAGSLLLLSVGILMGLRFDLVRYRPLAWLMAAMIALVVTQLIPLPPTVWRALPGRDAFDLSSIVPSFGQMWRPAAIVPDAAWNALQSLAVPTSAFLLMTAVPRARLSALVPALIAMIGLSSVVATFQFAGNAGNNPLLNERTGFVSGLFANRNHQALFLAIGIAASMQWGATRPFAPWRIVTAAVVSAWFVLMILATGSRAGLLLGLLALIMGALLVLAALRRAQVRINRRLALLAGLGMVLALGSIVTASLYAGRSESIQRLSEASIGEDTRVRAMPVVMDMVRSYMPVGAGQGSFQTLFRVVEPDVLLKPTYFNHAHNDFVEIVVEAGVPGVILLFLALLWFAVQAWQAWRLPPEGEVQRARLGAAIILLVLLASVVDYPARTPLIMVTLVIASGLLSTHRSGTSATLPRDGSSLYSARPER